MTKLPKTVVTPAHNGAVVEHFTGGVEPGINSPKRFLFPNSDEFLKHMAKAVRPLKPNNLKGIA
jgi:hypothetical protein